MCMQAHMDMCRGACTLPTHEYIHIPRNTRARQLGQVGSSKQLERPSPAFTFSSRLSPVIVCRCNKEGQCLRKVGRMKGMPTKLSAVGILVGTLLAIGNGGWAPARGRVRAAASGSTVPLSPRGSPGYRRIPPTLPVIMLSPPVILTVVIIGSSTYHFVTTQWPCGRP